MSPWAPQFVVSKVFPGMRNGFFIEAGASVGGPNESNTYLLEKSYGWTGLCVEPNKVFFDQLVVLRSAYCVNACLHDQDGELDFINAAYYGAAAQHVQHVFEARGITEYERYIEHHANYQTDILGPGSVVKMAARSVRSLLQEIDYDGDVHYFSLDVEGGEVFVLTGYPFEKNRLLSATVECHYPFNNHMVMCDYCMPVRDLMRKNGLVYLKTEGVDDIFVHVDLLRARF